MILLSQELPLSISLNQDTYRNAAQFARAGFEAAECCLNTAAGILQLAVGTDREHAVLARLEEGLFAAVTVGTPAARLAQNINAALESSRRVFSITLARRGTFTVSVASAEWGETSSWEMMLALAQQRL